MRCTSTYYQRLTRSWCQHLNVIVLGVLFRNLFNWLWPRIIQDELTAFLMAGNDTTSATLEWALKHLVAHQEWQTKLRNTLREQFDSTSPTGLQISKTITPELDATVEEALRVGSTAPFLFRRTKEDTNILGHHVPANTDILMLVS